MKTDEERGSPSEVDPTKNKRSETEAVLVPWIDAKIKIEVSSDNVELPIQYVEKETAHRKGQREIQESLKESKASSINKGEHLPPCRSSTKETPFRDCRTTNVGKDGRLPAPG